MNRRFGVKASYSTASSEDAEEEVRARLAAIVDSANDAIIGKLLDGTVTSWNPAAGRIFGYSAKDMIGQNIRRLIPSELAEEEDSIVAKISAGKSVRHYETVRLRKDGQRIHVSVTVSPLRDGSGKIIGASKIARDITERKSAEEHQAAALKEIKNLKAALDEHAIVAITDPQGRITFVNDKFCAISKYSREELLGQDHRIINSSYHSKEFIRELWTTIGRGKAWKGEIRNRAKDGSIYWVDTTIVPFLDASGKPHQYVAIRADITERKKAEEQIHTLNRDLQIRVRERTAELERALKELESFSYSVSHDLRAPLRHINGFAELLKESAEDSLPDNSRRYMDLILDSSKRMGRLIDDLLEFSRMGRTEVRHACVNLAQMAESAVRDLGAEVQGRDIEWKIGLLPEVRADASMMRQVFANLLANAVKYSRTREKAVIEIGSREGPEGEVVVFVRDNGVGFDMEYADKLFGVFQRLHSEEEFEGTGIGLANVKQIISRHGGRAWAEGRLDHGATFYFALPKPAEIRGTA
jgi:PAS domain S-box-containing protein